MDSPYSSPKKHYLLVYCFKPDENHRIKNNINIFISNINDLFNALHDTKLQPSFVIAMADE
jgi:hypothetical protein